MKMAGKLTLRHMHLMKTLPGLRGVRDTHMPQNSPQSHLCSDSPRYEELRPVEAEDIDTNMWQR